MRLACASWSWSAAAPSVEAVPVNSPNPPSIDELTSGREAPAGARRIPARVRQGLVVAVGLVAAAVFAPGLLSSRPDDRRDAVAPTTSPAPATMSPSVSARPGPLAWKTRGNLRNDNKYLAEVLKRVRRDTPTADSVLFAAGLPEGDRLALVAVVHAVPASPVEEVAEVLAVRTSPGQAVRDARVEGTGGLGSVDGVVGWAGRASNGRVYAVVLGRPAPINAEVSAMIDYRPDGSASRTWRQLQGPDGVAVVELGTAVDPAVALRSRPEGAEPTFLLLGVSQTDRPPGELRVPEPDAIDGLARPSYAGPDAVNVTLAVADGLRHVLDVTKAEHRVLWSGPLGEGTGVLVRARRRDGPTFHVLMSETKSPEVGPGLEVRRVPWALGDLMPWAGVNHSGPNQSFLINPSGAGRAVIVLKDDRRITVPIGRAGIAPINDGVAAVELAGAAITVSAPDGSHVMRGSLPELSGQDVSLFN